MEWMIMNCDGLKGLCSNLGVFVDGHYTPSDECFDTLESLLENVQEEDTADHSTRRQLAASHIIQQDLVPLLIDLEDDPEIFQLAMRLLVSLTQPVECLHESAGPGPPNVQSAPPWIWDVQSMLMEAKTACSSVKFIKAVFKEIHKIITDAGEYDLLESDCETINQCLLLIRNLLYLSDTPGQGSLSDISVVYMRCLFQCRIDTVLLLLLNTSQKDYWGVTLVQLISLLYRDMVSEIFVRLDDMSSCSEDSCDSSNCSRCETAMDRAFPFEPTFERSDSKSQSDYSLDGISDFKNDEGSQTVMSVVTDSKTVTITDTVGRQPSPLSKCFQERCQIESVSGHSSVENGNMYSECVREEISMSICGDSTCTLKSSVEKLQSASSGNSKSSVSSSSMDELGSQLTEFTFSFLQNGFMNLVNVLKDTLMSITDKSTKDLDDSYFLWSIAFFLKFARRKEIEFKKIKDVFTPDVFGFLVYEAISNGEEVLLSFKNNKSYTLNMRRLHLSVSALRELIKTLTFHRERGMNSDDQQYIEALQRELSNMNDLRQLFLWLIRMHQPNCHGMLFLRDVIVTNHYYLLLLEEWISRDFCVDKRMNMLNHVKQFASNSIMQKYGYLLKNFVRNDHHINNCIFTMMHHVAGDCLNPESLLQVDILKTFLHIWDTDVPITQEMNDLMEFVIHKFLSMAEENPLSCALKLFMETGDIQEDIFMEGELEETDENSTWTDEEMDKLFMIYAELEDCPNVVEKITAMITEMGVNKSQLEVVNCMYKMGWFTSEQLECFISQDKTTIESSPVLEAKEEETKERYCMETLEELSKLDEDKVIPHCVQKLKEENFTEQLQFIQYTLLEAAYVKIDGDYMEKKFVSEPLFKFYHAKAKALPVIYYNEEHEKIRNNVYMLALLQQLGLVSEEESGLMYPRIPHEMSVIELVEKARMLGEIDEENVKFDINSTADQITMTTKDDAFNFEQNDKPTIRKTTVKIPSVAWMQLISDYNSTGNHSLSGSSQASSSTHSMDFE
ncbi:hypothetical protein ACF0H5_020842 [Mactra antiquata]